MKVSMTDFQRQLEMGILTAPKQELIDTSLCSRLSNRVGIRIVQPMAFSNTDQLMSYLAMEGLEC